MPTPKPTGAIGNWSDANVMLPDGNVPPKNWAASIGSFAPAVTCQLTVAAPIAAGTSLVTVKVKSRVETGPSALTALSGEMNTTAPVGAVSSFRMTPLALPPFGSMVALTGFDSFTTKFSFGS